MILYCYLEKILSFTSSLKRIQKSYITQTRSTIFLVFIQGASIQNRPSFYSIAMLSCLVITPRKKHACFIPTSQASISAILASPKDRDVYLKLAFKSYLSSLVKIGWRKNSPRTSRKRSYFFVCLREQSRQVENRLKVVFHSKLPIFAIFLNIHKASPNTDHNIICMFLKRKTISKPEKSSLS